MADIALTASYISPVNETECEMWTLIAGGTITRGQAVGINTAGKAVVADASTGTQNNARGIALNGAASGGTVTILVQGSCYGFTLTQAYDAPIYLSNTEGALADAAGDVSLVAGRVKPMADGATPTKVLYVNFPAAM